ncbi:MAG TPA: M66 family metalloprotease [Nitrosopumilaceae archaeon]|nr:M66 family metalloprotease [Nitrosopumilaceae archaeon]
MRTLTITAIFIILLLSVYAYHQSFALVEGFQRTNFKLAHSPTICAVEPPPDPNFPLIGNRMLTQTEYATIDWSTKLNTSQGTPASHTPIWKITLVKVFLWQQKTFDYSNCDIIINYKEKPDDTALQTEIGGITQYDYEHHKASIQVYYLQVNINAIQNETRDANVIYTTTNWVPYYTGYALGDAQLGMIIRHEMGHALGLGHFLSDNPNDLSQWIHGYTSIPSIMVPVVIAIGNSHFDITPYDTYEIKLIYGNNGFGEIPVPQPALIPDWIKTNAGGWANGYVSDDDFIKGLQYLVKQKIINTTLTNPYSQASKIPSWIKNDAGWWKNNQISDDEFVKGIQYIIQHGIIKI